MFRMLLLTLAFALAALPGLAVAQSGTATATAEPSRPSQPWPEADPAEEGMDASLLDQAGERADAELPDISALVVARGGSLVYERYYGGQEADEPINVRSVTKSVVSTLIGIALADGDLESLDQTIGDLIPDRIP
ncbi:MAG: serine hydrolase, partial [Chloroflexota bacterium]|nr:serine hydrolase [Chloroflexota bacterium]